jgi:16S rRNA (uracil1498-N3)-methyltransferase
LPDAVPAFVWVERLVAPGAHLTLDDTAAHHVVRVCRARAGDSLVVTDGVGGLARCRVARIAPTVMLEVERVDREERESTAALLCGAPEGQRFDWVVEKLAELGVARVRPVHTSRSRWARAAVRPERWRRVAVAALEQSRGRFLVEVSEPQDLDEALASEIPFEVGVLMDVGGAIPSGVQPATEGSTLGVVGPSEGFTDSERAALLDQGLVAIALSASRLRTETAAVAWGAWWGAPR